MRRRWTVGLGTIGALALFGCGDDGSDDSAATTTAAAAEAATGDETTGDEVTGDEEGTFPDLDELGDGEGRVPAPDDALSPEEAREELLTAGYECGEIEDYAVAPDEMDLGVAPAATFGCDGDAGPIEVLIAADEAQIGQLFVLVESAACGFEPDLVLSGEGRWLAGPRDESDPDAIRAAADVLGTEVLPFECD